MFNKRWKTSKRVLVVFVTIVLVTSILSGLFAYRYGVEVARAQSASLTTQTLSGGVTSPYSYNIWSEGGYYYAKDAYGAIPSWGQSTNASDVINSAFNAENVTVHLLKGSYYLSTKILINYDWASLRSDGLGATLVASGGLTGYMLQVGDNTALRKKVIIDGIRFDGQNLASVSGIDLESARWTTINNVYLESFIHGAAINLNGNESLGCHYNTISNFVIIHALTGISLTGDSTTYGASSSSGHSSANYIHDGLMDGQSLTNSRGIQVLHGGNNKIDHIEFTGFQINVYLDDWLNKIAYNTFDSRINFDVQLTSNAVNTTIVHNTIGVLEPVTGQFGLIYEDNDYWQPPQAANQHFLSYSFSVAANQNNKFIAQINPQARGTYNWTIEMLAVTLETAVGGSQTFSVRVVDDGSDSMVVSLGGTWPAGGNGYTSTGSFTCPTNQYLYIQYSTSAGAATGLGTVTIEYLVTDPITGT